MNTDCVNCKHARLWTDKEQFEYIEKMYNSLGWHDFHEIGLDECYYDYAEDCLYVIRDRIYEQYYFVEARSSKKALDSMKEISEMIARSHYDSQAESEDKE